MSRARHLVLVNPSAGGGRAGRALPELERALRNRGLDYRLVMTASLEQGCEEARRAASTGEIPVVMGGDGLIGQIGGLLAAGNTRAVDVGEVNGRRFLCIASCGFDSDANRIANQAQFVRGNLVYFYAALRALAAWKPAHFQLVLDGDR